MKHGFLKGLLTGILLSALSCTAVVSALEGRISVREKDIKSSALVYNESKDVHNKFDLDNSGRADVLDVVKIKSALLNPYGEYSGGEIDENTNHTGSFAGGLSYSPAEINVAIGKGVDRSLEAKVLEIFKKDYELWLATGYPTVNTGEDFHNCWVFTEVFEDFTLGAFKEIYADEEWISKLSVSEKLTDDSNLSMISFYFECEEKEGYVGVYDENGEFVPYGAKINGVEVW